MEGFPFFLCVFELDEEKTSGMSNTKLFTDHINSLVRYKKPGENC